MRVISIKIKDNKGTVVVQPQNKDDLWHLMEIILPGDRVYGKTSRKIKLQNREGVVQKTIRRTINLGIKVEKVSLQTFPIILRIHGTVISGPEDISLGTYHTISVKENDIITIEKDYWPNFLLERLKKIATTTNLPKVLVVSIDEGDATFGIVSSYKVSILGRLNMSVSGKRYNPKSYELSLKEFFGNVLSMLKEYDSRYNPFKIVVVGPGFVKNHFKSFLEDREKKLAEKIIVENTSSSGETGIYEAIKRGILNRVLKEVQLFKDNELFDEFTARLGRDDKKVAYGLEEVRRAAELGAVDTLLILNSILRMQIKEKEGKDDIYEIIENVEKTNGKIHIIDEESEVGIKLKGFGGIVALLRYPLPSY
ncbi:MAG: mRNA surveillance protein pelota [Candidatus Asgardarchaeia archaeon]